MKNFHFKRIIAGFQIAILSLSFTPLTYTQAESLPNTGAPSGFAIESVASGLFLPTDASLASDGRIFVAQKDGVVRVVKDGAVLPQPFYTVPNVNNYVDRGLLGIELDPNFSSNGYVYLLYTYDNNPSNIAGPKTGQLLRVTAAGDTAAVGSEEVILGSNVGNSVQTSCLDFPMTDDCIAADGLSHAPAALNFGPDGKLYVSIGDASGYDDVDVHAFRAQNLQSLNGKILRINPDGTGVSDNPFYTGNPNDNQSKVFAYGMRNPFRFNIRESDGLILSGDVGWNTWEEINAVTSGANLGWPCYEGFDQQNGSGEPGVGAYKDFPDCQAMYQNPPDNLAWPLYIYPHPPSSSVIGGVFYEGSNYPSEYNGRYFFADYSKNQIYTMDLDENNQMIPNSNRVFASNTYGPVNFFHGADGDIYFVAINNGTIYHIDYSTENREPTAAISADKLSGEVPLTVQFSSAGTFDPDGDALAYLWDFGDGSTPSMAANPTHTYTTEGKFTVSLTVTDTFNNSSVKTIQIAAGQTAPTVTIASPVDLSTADSGQIINFSGSAVDAQDGPLTGDALKWDIIIHHCPLDSCHIHTVTSAQGATGSFSYPAHDKPFYIEITLTATNSLGLSSSKHVSVYPTGSDITHSLNLDGLTNYASSAAVQDFILPQFTVEAMIKTLATDDWGSEIVSMGNNWSIRIQPDGNVQFSFWGNGSWQVLQTSGIDLRDGLWHHVAATKSTTAMKIYVDGQLLAQSENLHVIEYAYARNLLIGQHGDEDYHFNFNGAIDEVRIWATPRSDADILAFHSSNLPEGEADLLAYWKMEEGNGNTVVDSGTGQHNLTLQNGTTWTAGAPISAANPPAPTNPISDFADTFADTTIDSQKWYSYGTTAQVSQNEQLTITPNTTSTGYFGVISAGAYSLTSSSIHVEVPQTTSNSSAETQLILEADADNHMMIGRTGSSLHLRMKVAGVNQDTFVPFDGSTMRWWRMSEVAGQVNLQTSPDSINWVTRRVLEPTFDLSKLKVILQAGTWEVVAAPGAATFDNLNSTPDSTSINQAVKLDGSQTSQLDILSDHYHYNTQVLTIESWVKVEDTGLWGAEIISNGNNYGLRVTPDGNIRFFTHTGSFVWNDYETTNVNVLDNQWHHIAVTKSSSSVTIYVDGSQVASFATSTAISYSLSTNFVIGRHGDGDNNFNLTGAVDEIRVWSKVRTAAEIAAHASQELAAQEGLVGYWKLNEGTGSVSQDSSGHNHPVALHAGVTWIARQ